MARKSIKDLRAEHEAAEALGLDEKKPAKKKAAKKKSTTKRTRKSAKAERKRLSWGILTGTLKEEARFPYDQRQEAEEKLAALLAKGRRLYFLQPIKESLSSEPTPPVDPLELDDEDVPKPVDPDAEPDEEDDEVEEADPPFAGEDDED